MIAMEQAAVFLFAVSGLLRACCSAVIARLVVATGQWSGEGQRAAILFLPGSSRPLFFHYYRVVFTLFLRHRKRNAD
jgi:hypothetical protein